MVVICTKYHIISEHLNVKFNIGEIYNALEIGLNSPSIFIIWCGNSNYSCRYPSKFFKEHFVELSKYRNNKIGEILC